MGASKTPCGAWRILAGAMTLFILSTITMSLSAQQSQGTILGVVRDPSGGAVAGATVTVTNTDTSETRTAMTGDDGAYRVPALQPGHYSVKAEAPGFKSLTVTSLNLEVGQEMVVNGAMQIGSTEQAVTVTGEATLVDTTNSALGSVVSEQQVSDLPLNGRNYLDLTFLQPGVAKVNFPVGGGAGAAGNWYSSNGAPPRSNNFTMDGGLIGNAYNTGPNSEANTTLGLDGIKEFKLVTSMFSAEYGMTMGSQMVMVSKGGSNNWHGDVFEYLRNNHMDARNFFDAPPSLLTDEAGVPQRNPQFKKNNFGASFGGPIKKDKTFFYLVYEGVRERQEDAVQDRTLPPACHILTDSRGNIYNDSATALPAGLLSAFPNGLPANGYYSSTGNPITQTPGTTWFAPGPGEVDPSGHPAPTARLYGPTAAGCATGLSGSSVIPQVIIPWIGQLPYPNEPGVNNGLGFFYPGTTAVREDYAQLRVDHNFSSANTLFARYTFDDAYEHVPYGNLNNSDNGTGYPQFTTIGRSRNQWLTLGENHIFSPSTLNQLRISWDRTNFSNWQKNYVTALNPFGPAANNPYYLFLAGVDSAGSIGPGSGTTAVGPTGAPTYHIQNIGTLGDDVFYTRGKHAFKFGTLMNMFQEPNVMQKGTYGTVSFSNISSFMTGVPSQFLAVQPAPTFVTGPGSQTLVAPFSGNYLDRDYLFKTFGFYVQDDWRAASRLTLNLGVRYEFMTTPHDLLGRQSTVPDLATSTTYRVGPIMDNPTFRNWSPRIGMAWDVFGNGRTAIRGGFGIYYDVANIGSLLTQNAVGVPPFGVQTTVFNTNSGCTSAAGCAVLSGQNFPFPLSFPPSEQGRALQMVDYQLKNPHSLQYNLTVQQQLPLGLALSVSYVGNRGINLYTDEDGNPVVPAGDNNGVPFYSVPNGLAQCFNNANIPGVGATPFDFTKTYSPATSAFLLANYGTLGSSAPCRVNPYWSSTIFITARSNSWYNGLQVAVAKRLSHGLSFQAGYTFSKSIDTTSGQMYNTDCGGTGSAVGDVPSNLKLDKGLSCFDLPQSVHFNLLYHFPTVSTNRGLAKILNGWWVGSIVSVQQGFPYSVLVSTERSLDGVQIAQNPGDRANLITTPSSFTTNLPLTPGSATTQPYTYNFIPFNPQTVVTGNPNNWFNPLMFGLNPLGTLGNSARDILRSPGLGSWDFSLVKDTKIGFLGEAGNLEIRAEVFNVLNRPNFGYPSGVAYTGATTNLTGGLNGLQNEAPTGASIANPFGTAGQITQTTTSSRQIQLALKLIF